MVSVVLCSVLHAVHSNTEPNISSDILRKILCALTVAGQLVYKIAVYITNDVMSACRYD